MLKISTDTTTTVAQAIHESAGGQVLDFNDKYISSTHNLLLVAFKNKVNY